jgi:hypothetical protein
MIGLGKNLNFTKRGNKTLHANQIEQSKLINSYTNKKKKKEKKKNKKEEKERTEQKQTTHKTSTDKYKLDQKKGKEQIKEIQCNNEQDNHGPAGNINYANEH